jgi:hypothetical protein
MGDLLGGVGKELGLSGAIGTGRVWARWVEVVGDAIADHAEPTSLKDGVLRIRTDSPTWATELSYKGAEIARRANEVAGARIVTEVRVWTGPGRIERHAAEVRTPLPEGRGETSAEILANEPLAALGRARAAWARRRARGRSQGPSYESGETAPRPPRNPG